VFLTVLTDEEVLMGRGGKRKSQGTFSRVGFRWMMCAFKQSHFSMLYIIYRAVEVSLQHDFRTFRMVPPILDALDRHVCCSSFDNRQG
jgi:hypothetical protein